MQVQHHGGITGITVMEVAVMVITDITDIMVVAMFIIQDMNMDMAAVGTIMGMEGTAMAIMDTEATDNLHKLTTKCLLL